MKQLRTSNLKLAYYTSAILLFAFIVALTYALFAPRKPKADIRIFFSISSCFNFNGTSVIKGTVALQNNTDAPLLFDCEELAANVNFVVVDNLIGKSHIANGNHLNSLRGLGINSIKTHQLKIMPRSTLESAFLTSFDWELQMPNVKNIYCMIKIDGETYYSAAELLMLK